ncbi:TonB-dependent receptor [Luteimonas huabeiensis]|uniref:TonB-dependent receptor n=1 Tax=Luteimonas huabeiensis TaxID=1244513 RepID=UPI000463C0A8|nr:TonB-dependent receptor [Luteimonas huabeiensis]
MRGKTIRRAALCMALGACLGAMAPQVQAQSVTGAVAGRATAGDQVVVTHEATGLTRSATVGADGTYRLGQLPVGDYTLAVTRGGRRLGEPLSVNVALGGTTTVNLGSEGGIANLAAVQVVGSRVVNRVDVRSTESATSITREEWARLPVGQSLDAVALLAPGVVGGNASFGGISFGGSSVAENSVFINGLNVTDFYRRQSYSSAPFAFFQEYQVKTGGYSVEFGRATGGVINAVTRSGSNEFAGGVELTFEPAAWKASADDHEFAATNSDGTTSTAIYRASRDRSSFTKANVWASGPIVRDRLFLFAMYEARDRDSKYSGTGGGEWFRGEAGDGFWGAKMDWRITDNHLLELLAFSDETETDTTTYAYDWDTKDVGEAIGSNTEEGGGKSGSLTYTGYFGEHFVAKAMYGINRSRAFSSSPADGPCEQVSFDASYRAAYEAMGSPTLGCHPTSAMIVAHEDEREAARLDFEWTLGNHQLRFGIDREVMTTDRTSFYPGPTGMRYTAYAAAPGAELDNGAVVPPGVDAILMARRRVDGGVFETEASAYYIEDTWSITPNFLLNLGVRVDGFENKTAAGGSFIEMDDLVSPRAGFSWDMRGDGSTKLFGNLGRYYLPVTNNINYTFAGGLTDERTFYVLEGWRQATNPVTGGAYMEPIVGSQIGPVDTSYNVTVNDLRQSVDADLDAVYQDEAILGYQAMLSPAWSWGVNATYRRMKNALDDVRINHTPCGPVGGNLWPIANPGKPLTIWGDASIGCETEGWITIDTSRDGYMKGGSGEVVGYSEPKRTYRSVELQIDRAWDGKWAFNASYIWSKSHGNHEGPVNSDTNYGDTGMVQHWDHPANNQDYGPLFNDRRHQIKLRGSYALNHIWSFGATFTALSGGPINQLGVTWPDDTTGAGSFVTEGSGGGSFWHCVQNCAGPVAGRVYEYAGRGAGGRLPWTYNIGANVTWTLPVDGIDLKARLAVFNLLNDQEVINVRQRYELGPGVVRGLHGTGTRWQSPRYAQLVVTWNF